MLDCHTAHIACKFAETMKKLDRHADKATEEKLVRHVELEGDIVQFKAFILG